MINCASINREKIQIKIIIIMLIKITHNDDEFNYY